MSEPREPSGPTDRQMETAIGNLLRIGVLLAAAIVLIGGGVYLVRHGAEAPDYHRFRGEPPELCSPRGIIHYAFQWHGDAFELRGRGIIQLGFLLLIATPVARVAACSIAFAFQRDKLYVVVSLIVLALLAYSLLVGSV
jgi:uncharacterized membrane protein